MFLKFFFYFTLTVSVYCNESTFRNVILSIDFENVTIEDSNSLKEFLPKNPVTDVFVSGIIPILPENSVADITTVEGLTFDGTQIEDIQPGAFKNSTVKSLTIWKNNLTVIKKSVFNELKINKLDISYNPNLETIEDGALDNPNIETLKLSANKLRSFHKNVFRKLPNLKYLELNENGIETLQKEPFQDLPLTTLDLSFNPFLTLPDFLLDLKQLTHISFITKTQLVQIPKGVFNNHPTLQKVSVSFSNVESIDSEAFDNMPQLTSVNLAINNLTKIDNQWFHNSPNLKNLDFSDNQIEEIPSEAFKNLEKVKEGLMFNFEANKIKKIAPDAFKGLKKIYELILSNNTLEKWEGSYLESVEFIADSTLDLSYNEIKCPDDFNQVFKAEFTYLKGNPLTAECLMKISEWKEDATSDHTVSTD